MQRADVGGRSAVLKVREPGRTTFVVAVAGRGVGLVESRPAKPEGGRSFGKLEGFRVAWLDEKAAGLVRGDERARIDAARGAGMEVEVGREAWTEAPSAEILRRRREDEREAWLARGAGLAGDSARDELAARRARRDRGR